MKKAKRKKSLRMRPKQLAELLRANLDQLTVLFGNLGAQPLGSFVADVEHDAEENDVLLVCETADLEDVRDDPNFALAYYATATGQEVKMQCGCPKCRADRMANLN